MQSEEQFLPPAAIEGWFRLARAVVRITADPQERQEWIKWGRMRQALREIHQAPCGGGLAARRMGDFDGRAKRSQTKRHTTED